MATLFLDPETIESIDPAQYPFVMTAEEAIIAAQSLTELVAALPGIAADYAELDDASALGARYDHAVVCARTAQDELARDNEDFDPSATSEAALTALFGVPKSVPLTGLEAWNGPVPLVLIATDYAPYIRDAFAPLGNVKLINPADERSYLDTLVGVGLIDLVVAS